MESRCVSWFFLVALCTIVLQADGIHGKTVSLQRQRGSHGLDERMVRRNRMPTDTSVSNATISQANNSTTGTSGRSANDEDDTEDVTESPLTSSEMDMILDALSKNNASTSESTELTESEEEDEEDEDETKFSSSTGQEITLEHVDFVMLRLQHISRSVSDNLTEILDLQKKEFKLNPKYEEGWLHAVEGYNRKFRSRKTSLFSSFVNETNSVVYKVPDEYHIALMAYTDDFPSGDPVYYYFNRATREVCSGKDVEEYHYKSLFKLLELAIKALNKEPKLRDSKRFLYRGINSKVALEEGQIIAFQHFVSTSAMLTVAEEFAGQTLLEIQGFYDTGLNVSLHSEFAEDEVLFYPLQVFKVESIHVGKHYTRYVLVGHKWKGVSPTTNNGNKGCIIGSIEDNSIQDSNENDNDVSTTKTVAKELKNKNGATANQITFEGLFLILVGVTCALKFSN